MTAEQWLTCVVFPLGAYVVGATPVGVLIAAAKGVNLRAEGSGNIGATNVGRVVGRKWGYLCFLADVAKGLVPVLLAGLYLRAGEHALTLGQQVVWLGVALGAVLGHVLPFWLKFRGGKGVATSLGVTLGIWPYFTIPGLAAFALWVAVTMKWRYVSLGSVVAAVAFPPMFVACSLIAGWPLAGMMLLVVFSSVMCIMVIVRHRGNIRRLIAGTENKIGARKAAN